MKPKLKVRFQDIGATRKMPRETPCTKRSQNKSEAMYRQVPVWKGHD